MTSALPACSLSAAHTPDLHPPCCLDFQPLWNNLLVHCQEQELLVEGPLSNLMPSMMQFPRPRQYYTDKRLFELSMGTPDESGGGGANASDGAGSGGISNSSRDAAGADGRGGIGMPPALGIGAFDPHAPVSFMPDSAGSGDQQSRGGKRGAGRRGKQSSDSRFDPRYDQPFHAGSGPLASTAGAIGGAIGPRSVGNAPGGVPMAPMPPLAQYQRLGAGGAPPLGPMSGVDFGQPMTQMGMGMSASQTLGQQFGHTQGSSQGFSQPMGFNLGGLSQDSLGSDFHSHSQLQSQEDGGR